MSDLASVDASPRILVTRAEEVVGEDWQDYVRCIERAGGQAVPFDCSDFVSIEDLPPVEGLLVTAGMDIDPARYGAERSERTGDTDPDRDAVEAILIQHALDADRPLFAICRGSQMVNVTCGGSLLQHIEERDPHRARRGADGVAIDSGWHEVEVRPASLLASIVGTETVRTNSRHHQAITAATLAPRVLATGVAPDGVIEAIEVPGHAWALAVQWHPERPEMTDDPAMRNASTALFEAFVAACARGSGADA